MGDKDKTSMKAVLVTAMITFCHLTYCLALLSAAYMHCTTTSSHVALQHALTAQQDHHADKATRE